MRGHSALTQWGVSPAPAILDTVEMESTVQVSYYIIELGSFIYITLHLVFADINECELKTHNCSYNANCTDTDGSFNCTCTEGFKGDGFNCTGKLLVHEPAVFVQRERVHGSSSLQDNLVATEYCRVGFLHTTRLGVSAHHQTGGVCTPPD